MTIQKLYETALKFTPDKRLSKQIDTSLAKLEADLPTEYDKGAYDTAIVRWSALMNNLLAQKKLYVLSLKQWEKAVELYGRIVEGFLLDMGGVPQLPEEFTCEFSEGVIDICEADELYKRHTRHE